MLSPASVPIVGARGQQETAGQRALRALDMDDFLKLLITELQYQDPMNPMSNYEILQQIGQIREVESNMQMIQTLESLRLAQSLAVASNIMGRSIVAETDDAQQVTGRVEGVSIVDGQPKLKVGQHLVDLEKVGEILASSADS